MSSADLLRRAAAKLRHHAEQAVDPLTDGEPWTTRLIESSVSDDAGLFIVAERNNLTSYIAEGFLTDAHASYIALMHPPVALALADLLDGYAEWFELPPFTGFKIGNDQRFIALAREVLREPEEAPDA